MSDIYDMSSSDLSYASSIYGNGLSSAGMDNYTNTNMVHDIINGSLPILTADGWDAVRGSLQTYEDCLVCAQNLNSIIEEANREYIDSIQRFLAPDNDLNTSDLPKYEAEKSQLEQEKLSLQQQNTLLADTPKTITVFYGYDENGNAVYGEEPNPDYAVAMEQIATNNARITDVIEPAIKEAQRLIDKINTFVNDILPQLNARLDEVNQQVNSYMEQVRNLAVGMPQSSGPAVTLLAARTEAETQTKEDRMLYIYDQLTSRYGYSDAGAKAIIANINAESPDFSSRQWQSNNPDLPGYGLCQWEFKDKGGVGTADDMVDWCSQQGIDYTTIDGQLAWLDHHVNLVLHDPYTTGDAGPVLYNDLKNPNEQSFDDYISITARFGTLYEGQDSYDAMAGRGYTARNDGLLDAIDADNASSEYTV